MTLFHVPQLLAWLSSEVNAALAGGLLAGAISVGLSYLSHRREAKERCAAAREHDRAEHDRWLRDRMYDIYSQAIYYLVKLGTSAPNLPKDQKDVRQHFSECQRFLNLLRGYHATEPDAAAELQTATKALETAWNQAWNQNCGMTLSREADKALGEVKALFEKDPRIQRRQP